jgi:predicted O-methyltransferase YrrM
MVVDDSDKNPYSDEAWRQTAAKSMREFNDYVANEPRLEVVVLPLFDGIGLIRLKE